MDMGVLMSISCSLHHALITCCIFLYHKHTTLHSSVPELVLQWCQQHRPMGRRRQERWRSPAGMMHEAAWYSLAQAVHIIFFKHGWRACNPGLCAGGARRPTGYKLGARE